MERLTKGKIIEIHVPDENSRAMKTINHLAIICIKAPIDSVREGFVNEFPEAESSFHFKETTLKLKTLYKYFHQQTGGSMPIQCILYSPSCAPESTIFYTNLSDGWNHFAQHYLIKHNHWETYFTSINIADDIVYPSFQFFKYGGNSERFLICQKEPNWVFYQEGEPLPFEDIERYKRRLKRERVDAALLLKYMRAAGWNLEDDSFWTPIGDVIQFNQKSQA